MRPPPRCVPGSFPLVPRSVARVWLPRRSTLRAHLGAASLRRGYNIGIRLVDEFLAKAKISKCNSFRETADVIAKGALPMFLNIQATVTNWSPDGTECSLVRRARAQCLQRACS